MNPPLPHPTPIYTDLHIRGRPSDGHADLPQVLQEVGQHLRGPLPQVVVRVLQLLQLGFGGVEERLSAGGGGLEGDIGGRGGTTRLPADRFITDALLQIW